MYVLGYSDIGAAVGIRQALVPPFLAARWRLDTLELDPRLRHAAGFLGQTPLMLIDGELVPAVSGKTFAVYNPATGAVIANVPEADKKDVDIAVAAARRAFDERRWAKVSPSERGRMLWKLADLIERDLEDWPSWNRSTMASPTLSRASPICRWRSICSAIWAAGRPRSQARRSRCLFRANTCPTP